MHKFLSHINPFYKNSYLWELKPMFIVTFAILNLYFNYYNLPLINWFNWSLIIMSPLILWGLFSYSSKLLCLLLILITAIFQNQRILNQQPIENLSHQSALTIENLSHQSALTIEGSLERIYKNRLQFFAATLMQEEQVNQYQIIEVQLEKDLMPLMDKFIIGNVYRFTNLHLIKQQNNILLIADSNSEFQNLTWIKKTLNYSNLYNIVRSQLNYYSTAKSEMIIKALLIGEKNIEPAIKTQLMNLGIYHLVSISGLHLVQLYILLYTFTAFIIGLVFNAWKNKIYFYKLKKIAISTTILICFYYAYFLQFPIPALRAVIFLTMYLILQIFFPYWRNIFKILFIALLMILFEPSVIGQGSFNLSFLAVVAIALSYNLVVRFYDAYKNNIKIKRIFFYLMVIILSSILINLLSLPLFINLFQKINLLQPINNLIHIPILTFIVLPLLLIGVGTMILVSINNSLANISEIYFNFINILIDYWLKLIKINDLITRDFVINFIEPLTKININLWYIFIILFIVIADYLAKPKKLQTKKLKTKHIMQ